MRSAEARTSGLTFGGRRASTAMARILPPLRGFETVEALRQREQGRGHLIGEGLDVVAEQIEILRGGLEVGRAPPRTPTARAWPGTVALACRGGALRAHDRGAGGRDVGGLGRPRRGVRAPRLR